MNQGQEVGGPRSFIWSENVVPTVSQISEKGSVLEGLVDQKAELVNDFDEVKALDLFGGHCFEHIHL